MSILRMETETARQAAHQMLRARRTAEEEAFALRRALDRLSSAWQGRAAADFLAQAGRLSSALSEHLAALEELACRLEREVEEWEETARRGAWAWRNLASAGRGSLLGPVLSGGAGGGSLPLPSFLSGLLPPLLFACLLYTSPSPRDS